MRVFINLGHGGRDPGAVGNGLKEKDLVLKIGKIVYDRLKDYNLTVKMFRDDDTFYSLRRITDEANKWKADLFISIHVNAGGGTGFESFIFNGNVSRETNRLQSDVHSEIMKAVNKHNIRDRGKKRANFHVLRETSMSAVLTENLFIDTKRDAELLRSDKFINDVATGHVNGIVKFTGAKRVKTERVQTERVNTEDSDNHTYYRVVTGSFRNRENANNRVEELKKKGFDSFIDIHRE